MSRRRVWNDRALESTRAGWIMTGAACSFALLGVILLAADVAAGAAWWAYVLLAVWPPLIWFTGLMGRRERARALEQRATMRGYSDSITSSFEALLKERGPGQ